jgi:16S rRNA C1402 N4-methylase RsmH
VTEFLREHELAPESFPLRQWCEQQSDIPPLTRGPGLRRAPAVCPSEAELKFNSRSRSAVLHILHKVNSLTNSVLHCVC